MIPCPDVETIERLCEGRAEDVESAAWSAHVGACATCRDLAEQIAANLAALVRWGRLPVSDGSDVDAPRPPDVPGVIVQGLLSSGGQGVLWRGVQISTERQVAVKTIRSGADAAARARFGREARLGARLRHPHLVTVLDAGATPAGELYLVMEFVAGETLEAARQSGAPSFDDALRCFQAIADGVRFAHQHGVLHRDLKPSNILRTPDGGVRILDFGLAKLLDDVGVDVQSTLEGTFVGTLACAAPEQLRFDGAPIDVRTDLFQLGVVFYRYLTGAWPHAPRADPRAMLGMRLHDVPTRPSRLRPDLPLDCDSIVLRLLAPEPAQRYATANELCADLERLQRGEPIAARAEELRVRLARLVGRYRATMFASAAIALVLAITVAIVLDYAHQAAADRAAIAREFARAEELLGILSRSMETFDVGAAGPQTPMVDFLDRVVVELEARPTVDVQGRADLLLRAADVYSRIADPQRAARFVERARGLVRVDGAVASDTELLLHAEEMRLRLAATLPDPTILRDLPPLLTEFERRFGADHERLLELRILEQLAVRADREPAAAYATMQSLATRVDAMPVGAPRERLSHVLDYAWIAVASAAGERDEALYRARTLLAAPVGASYADRARRFAILQVVCPMALDSGDLEFADATTAECVALAGEIALPSDPRRAAAQFARGLCLMRLGRSDDALPLLREFVTLVDGGAVAEPRKVALACVLLASPAADAGDVDDAIDLLARARALLAPLGPSNDDDVLQIEYQLGVLLVLAERGAEALPVLDAALARARRLEGTTDAGGRIAAIEGLLARIAR